MQYQLNHKGVIVKARIKPPTEDREQANCIRWFDIQYPKLWQHLFHIPNGGKRDKREAAKLKRMGVRRGVADLFLSIACNGFHGLYIEMKRVGETQTESQKEFQRKVVADGYVYALCFNTDEFIVAIQSYLQHSSYYKPIWKQIKLSS